MAIEKEYDFVVDLSNGLKKIQQGYGWGNGVHLTDNEARAIHNFIKMVSK